VVKNERNVHHEVVHELTLPAENENEERFLAESILSKAEGLEMTVRIPAVISNEVRDLSSIPDL
jgi:hypothetical protein